MLRNRLMRIFRRGSHKPRAFIVAVVSRADKLPPHLKHPV